MGSVVVVGTVNQDLVLRVARLPLPGQTILASGFEVGGGGKGGNQAAAAASAGAPTTLVAAVGDDDAGRTATRELAAAGVDVGHVIGVAAPTGTAVVLVDDDGGNSIVVAPGANALLDVDLVDRVLAGAPGPGVCLCSAEVPDAVVDAALVAAGRRGWTPVYNCAPSRPLTDTQRAARPLLVVNETEAADLSGAATSQAAATALQRDLGSAVVVTLGARGALVADGSASPFLVASPAATVVDTTGAGDVFCGTLAAALAAGDPLGVAVERACAAGSRATTWPGARRPALTQ